MAARVTSGRIVGRERELADLEAALARASSGEPSVAFIAGESGVGKSRLLTELRDQATDQGAVVLSGDSVALGDGELPYSPIVAALRPLARARDPVLQALAPAAQAELGRLLPDLGNAAGASAPAAVDADPAAQGRLFEALLMLLERLGQRTPVLLAIEDVHWADRSTRAFLTFLVRSLQAERLLVVITYRSDELHRRHPLRPLLADLERDPRTWRIDLEPLDRAELAEMLEGIRGSAVPAALVDRLWSRSEGNPLYTEELLAAGSDGRGPLPESLRDALMLRIDALPPAAQHVLRLIAVAARIDHETLAEASGLPRAELAEAIRAGVSAHIVVADEEGRHAFRHALLAEVVEEDLLPGERVELHRALATALEHRLEEGAVVRPAAVAHHWYAAGDAPAAFAASLRAADAAEHVHAYGEAADLLERALELWERLPDPTAAAGCDHVSLLIRAGDAHRIGQRPDRAETLLVAALDEIDETEYPHKAVDALTRLAHARWQLNRTEEALATAERGMAMLGPEDDSQERARLLGWWANSRMLQGRYREAVRAAREALEMAERADSDAAEQRALNALGISLAATGKAEEGLALLRRRLELAQARGPADQAAAYVNLADALLLDGRTREALEVAREGAERVNFGGRMDLWLRTSVSEIAFDAGDWGLAAEFLPPGERRVEGTTRLNLELRRAELAMGRGDEEAAASTLDDLDCRVEGSTEPQFLGPFGVLQAERHLRRGDIEAARATVDEALDRLEFCTEDLIRLARVAWVGVVVEATRAVRARDRRDEAEAAEAVQGAAMHLLRVRAAADGGRRVGEAMLASAKADAARARGYNSPARWERAAAAWLEIERPYPAAIARLRQAEAHAADEERPEAEEAAGAALATARQLGSRWLVQEIEWLAARARLRLDREGAPDAAAAIPELELPFGLTPREAQVLAMLARGATNREVGEALYMAEKTASVHVSRILRKLGVRSRTEAAAVAHRHGLASGPVPDAAGRA